MHNTSSPAFLWIGPSEQLIEETDRYLQSHLCKKQGCLVCSTCLLIQQKQHPSCLWLNPEHTYTLELLKPLFSTISRSLQHGEKFFFIFCNADYLSHACTNSLLKSIEEPPAGYHFLFLAKNIHTLSRTLRSRCIVRTYAPQASWQEFDEFVSFFTKQPLKTDQFLAAIEKKIFDDKATLEIVNGITEYWVTMLKRNLKDDAQTASIRAKLQHLKNASENPPMPGSTKIFWKNLFLQLNVNC